MQLVRVKTDNIRLENGAPSRLEFRIKLLLVSKIRVAFLEEVLFELHFEESYGCGMELMVKKDIPRGGYDMG